MILLETALVKSNRAFRLNELNTIQVHQNEKCAKLDLIFFRKQPQRSKKKIKACPRPAYCIKGLCSLSGCSGPHPAIALEQSEIYLVKIEAATA